MELSFQHFQKNFERFKRLAHEYDGHPFTDLREGVVGVWENYKPKLREFALAKLNAAAWDRSTIGQGRILGNTIAAIEIQDNRPGGLTNNMVQWQNRWGHMSREHRLLLDAQQDVNARKSVEAVLFELYRTDNDPSDLFDRLSGLTGQKYTLSAYLFFLRDMDRFMPIQPTGFDEIFAELDVELRTLRHCSWANYEAFNDVLAGVQKSLVSVGQKNVRLIDAHSFCWAFRTLIRRVPEDSDGKVAERSRDDGRRLGGLDRSITDMRMNILGTVSQSRGQIVTRNVQMKIKDLGFDSEQNLDVFLRERMRIQEGRCALTGIQFNFHGDIIADKNLHPSPDRIDSDGHYTPGNIQIVCRFVNMWKSNTKNDEFVRLLSLVRGQDIAG